MAASTSTMTFAPHQSSPLARTISPFKDPRPPPCTPEKTAKLWDEYERRAVENARERDRTPQTLYPQRTSASDVGKSNSTSAATTTRSSFDFKFRRPRAATLSTTVAMCKHCKQPITYTSGICERCKRTIVLPTPTGETTPPLSPSARNFASTDLQLLHKNSSVEEVNMPMSTSPKDKSFCPLPAQFADPPIRLSSLRPPPTPDAVLEPARSRKVSLTDPNEPFLRLQITQQHYQPRSQSHPTTPTYTPTTPPSTSHSRSSTRPSSLANIALLPASAYPYVRNSSITPSEFSALYPYSTNTTTSPPSVCRVSDAQPVTTSAWDDWDSDEEEEKVRLVGWIGRRKGKGKGSVKESKGSMDSSGSEGELAREREKRKKEKESMEQEDRLERVRVEMAESARKSLGMKKKKMKRSGFVRALSCGCRDD